MRAVMLSLALLVLLPSALRAADGDPDPSFGSGGSFAAQVQGSGGLAIQSDGKIVAGGSMHATASDPAYAALARLDASGNPDPTFGTSGLVVTGFTDLYFTSVAVAPDGGVLALGVLAGDLTLVRFTAAGVLDASFGTGGVVTTDCGGTEVAEVVLARADGTIVVTATSGPNGCVVGYLADGSLDPSFGSGAPVLLPGWNITSSALQSDGKVVIAGQVVSPATQFAVGRLLADGTFDGSFGHGNGVATNDLPPDQLAAGVVVQPNGDVVAVDARFVAVRYRANGSLDHSFGTNGVAAPTLPSNFFTYDSRGLAVQPDAKIVVVGVASNQPVDFFAELVLVRYDVDGTLDPTYGTGGMEVEGVTVPTALRVQPDGKAVTFGTDVMFPLTSKWDIMRTIGFSYTCPAMPLSGCKTSITPLASTLKLAKGATPAKNQEQWKWQDGADTTLADFGDPLGGDHVAVCAYDESSTTPTLAALAVVSGAGSCKGKPCWKALGPSRIAYHDPTGASFGISAIKLTSGIGGKASIQLKGKGADVELPSLPLGLPLRWQLDAEGGACFESTLSTTGVGVNTASKFNGKSD